MRNRLCNIVGAGLLIAIVAVAVMTGKDAGVSAADAQSLGEGASGEPQQLVRRRALRLAAVMGRDLSPLGGWVTFSLSAKDVRLVPESCVTYPSRNQPWEAEAHYVAVMEPIASSPSPSAATA